MNNRAFTMIEVIAIIALLGVILIISLPKFFSSKDESKIREKELLIEVIKNAGALYFTNNELGVDSEVELSLLCSEDYIKCPVKDPITNTNMSGKVKKTINGEGILTYTYIE